MVQPGDEIKQDLHYSVEMENFDDADEMFVLAKDRLLDVNNWHKIAQSIGATFTCIDHHGHQLRRKVHKGDFIKVISVGVEDILLYVEAIEYHDYPDDNLEGMSLVVNSATIPKEDSNNSSADTELACFIVQRHGIKLTALLKTELGFRFNINWNIILREFLKTDDED